MARTAEQAIVLEPALTSAVRDGHDVIRFPTWSRRAPELPRGAIAGGRFGPRPLTMRLYDIEAAELARALIAFLDLPAHVPRAAPDLPFVYTFVTTEGAPGRHHGLFAPAANRLTQGVAFGNSPLIGGDDTRAASAHA